MIRFLSQRSPTVAAVGVGISLMMTVSASAAASFAGFAGDWRGSGTVTTNAGVQEKIRCKGAYGVRPDNQALNINLLCASDSYRINIISNVVAQGTEFSGQWQETTRQVQGSVTGSILRAGQIQADLQGLGFGIRFSSRINGSRQAVSVLFQGTEVQGANITLSR